MSLSDHSMKRTINASMSLTDTGRRWQQPVFLFHGVHASRGSSHFAPPPPQAESVSGCIIDLHAAPLPPVRHLQMSGRIGRFIIFTSAPHMQCTTTPRLNRASSSSSEGGPGWVAAIPATGKSVSQSPSDSVWLPLPSAAPCYSPHDQLNSVFVRTHTHTLISHVEPYPGPGCMRPNAARAQQPPRSANAMLHVVVWCRHLCCPAPTGVSWSRVNITRCCTVASERSPEGSLGNDIVCIVWPQKKKKKEKRLVAKSLTGSSNLEGIPPDRA